MDTYTTQTSRLIHASRAAVYRAIIDPIMIAKWKVPDGMTMQIHKYDAHENGKYRISLSYDDSHIIGKTARNIDTYHGKFAKLVPNKLVVQCDEFESENDSLHGIMTSTYQLSDSGVNTLVECTHENVPASVAKQDNKIGWEMALNNLATLIE